ncbi:MAG: hypothetical protein WC755_05800 [Candidatus Woesearchaeota archaeon]|jgi:hypothetical protein
MRYKKGETTTSGAFALVLFTVAFIILYILLIPQADRDYLLNGNSNNTDTSILSNNTASNVIFSKDNLQLSPNVADDEFDISLEPFELYTKVQGKKYLDINPVHVTRSIVFNNKKMVTFDVNNYKDLKSMQLHFKADIASGKLRIKVNNYLVSEFDDLEFSSSKDLKTPILIDKNILKEKGNIIIFEVASPGVYFWKISEYDLKYITLYENVEIYNQQATVTFDFSKEELVNIEEATLKYSVTATDPGNVEIFLNNRLLFSGEPALQGESKHRLFSADLKEHNALSVISQKGSYNFFGMSVEGTYNQAEEDKYYINIDKKERKYEIIFDLIDTVNQKRFYFYINENHYSVDTRSDSMTIDITDSVKAGRNTLVFTPTGKVAIANLKITEK